MDEITLPGPAKPLPSSQVSPTPASPPPAADGPGRREPRELSGSRGTAWWTEGWQVFMAAPGTWIGLVLLMFVIVVAMAFVPILGTIAQSVLAPVFAGGIALGAHALARGKPLTVGHLFEGFSAGRFLPLVIVGLFYLAAAFVFWLVFIVLVLGMAGGAGLFSALTSGGANGWAHVLASLGVAALVFVPIAMIGFALIAMAYWYAPALVVLNGEEPIEAMKKSFRACWRNMGAMLIYGLVFIALSIVASLPFGLGWIVLAPVLAGSWYASWRETFDA